MADESLLDGLDPFELLDHEADRVHRHFSSSPDWSQASRCEGWSTRDMLGHLMGLEDYTRAGLDGRVQDLFRAGEVAGVLDVGAFNDWQISTYADVPVEELVGRWREAQVANRVDLRSRGRSGLVDTSVGDYSSWLQTFHYAVEYATHGDDVFVPVPDSERAERIEWRAVFGQFVLLELEKPVIVERGLAVSVTSDAGKAELTPEEFVEATQGRLSADHSLHPELRNLLATV